MSLCTSCQKSVYAAEKLYALDKDWHKFCFKCVECKKTLSLGQFLDHNNNPYCKGCHSNLKQAGYGYAGSINSYDQKNTSELPINAR